MPNRTRFARSRSVLFFSSHSSAMWTSALTSRGAAVRLLAGDFEIVVAHDRPGRIRDGSEGRRVGHADGSTVHIMLAMRNAWGTAGVDIARVISRVLSTGILYRGAGELPPEGGCHKDGRSGECRGKALIAGV